MLFTMLTTNVQREVRKLLKHPRCESHLILEISYGDAEHRDRDLGPSLEGDYTPSSVTVEVGQRIPRTIFRLKRLKHIFEQNPFTAPSQGKFRHMQEFVESKESDSPPPKIVLSAQDITRWNMVSRALCRETVLNPTRLLVDRCRDWPDVERILKVPVATGFGTAALVYGGLHALAWSAHFQSPTQQLLWRISACVVMGSLPILFGFVRFIDECDLSISIYDKILSKIAIGPLLLLFLAYVLARAYLVVECFISLSHLSARVYDIPNWSAYFPHIS